MTEKMNFTRLACIRIVVRIMDKTVKCLTTLGIGPFKPSILSPDTQEKYRGKMVIPGHKAQISCTEFGEGHPHGGGCYLKSVSNCYYQS